MTPCEPEAEETLSVAPAQLREGFSTGACATALCVAGWRNHAEGVTLSELSVLFPDGIERTLTLRAATKLSTREPLFCITKDGGDDPDCTHGAVIYGRFRACTPADARPEDYRLAVGEATLLLRGVEGIGLCTRPGLDCEQGKWAINIGPRRMIAANLARVGMTSGLYLAELGIERGAELAKHTLNPQLGIVGGLSVLGTTGLVRPFSHDAYIRTVQICVHSNALLGGKTMVLCTGGRTKSGAQRALPDLPETAFVCIGDFIAESLRAACSCDMEHIVVACMAGKLCKYASGFDNTHAHKVRQDMDQLRQEVRRLLPEDTALHIALHDSVSVREALLSIPATARPNLLHRLADSALHQLVGHMTGQLPSVRLLLFDFDGTLMLDKSTTPTPCARTNAALDIVSCGIGNLAATLRDPDLCACLQQADVVFASRNLLEQLARTGIVLAAKTTVVIGAQAGQDAQHALELFHAGKRVAVLASGDALYHGFGGTLARLLATAPDVSGVRYHPNITAFQALFHRLGLPWDDARLFSAHQDSGFSLRELVEAPLAVIYGGSRAPAHDLAQRILAFHPAAAARPAIVAENLRCADPIPAAPDPGQGSDSGQGAVQDTAAAQPGERLLRGTLAELATVPVGPTSLLVLLPPPASTRGLPLALGLPEDAYERENNLITPSDVRAVILARLRLPASGVLWDIGAGSGSVGLEAAALRPRLQVFAVEKNPDRVALIAHNRLRLGVGNHSTLHADAVACASRAAHAGRPIPESTATSTLPRPDRIFVGGGGEQLIALLEACYTALQPGGLLLVSAVTLETLHRLYAWSPERRTDLTALDIAHEQPLAGRYHHLKPQHRITLFTFYKPDNVLCFNPQSTPSVD